MPLVDRESGGRYLEHGFGPPWTRSSVQESRLGEVPLVAAPPISAVWDCPSRSPAAATEMGFESTCRRGNFLPRPAPTIMRLGANAYRRQDRHFAGTEAQ